MVDDGTLSLAASQLAPASSDVPTPGQRVGRFVVRARLGEGGMGVVLAGHDPDLDRPVAIKLVRAGSTSPGYRARLMREAQALARLDHPNVVTVYEVGTEGEQIYLAMELVEGVTLTRWLAQRRRAWREVVAMFVAIGEGVAAVHRAGLVHRDLKPDNVLVDGTGRARVADFGLARLVTDDAAGSAGDSPGLGAKLTRTGAVMGTPGYMAPEQQWGAEVDARADQYSFCVALRAALAAVPLAAQATLDERTASAPRPVAHDWSGVPRRVRDVVTRGLSYDPSERYATMDELLAALRKTVASRRGRVATVAATGVFSVGVVATTIAIATSGGAPGPGAAAGRGAAVAAAPVDAGGRELAAAPVDAGGRELAAAPVDAGGRDLAAPAREAPPPPPQPGRDRAGAIGPSPGAGTGSGSRPGVGSAAPKGVEAAGPGSATPSAAVALGDLPIVDEAHQGTEDDPRIPDAALLPAVGFDGPPDAAVGPGPMTARRRQAIRSIAAELGYHGLDRGRLAADPAGVEARARDVLTAAVAAHGDDDWDAHVARIVLAMVRRYRGDCDEASTLAVTTIKRIRAALAPAVYDYAQLSADQLRWYGRAHALAGMCWFGEKDLAAALDKALGWLSPANELLAAAEAGHAERAEIQLAFAMIMFEKNDPPTAMAGWLDLAEARGGRAIKRLVGTWRDAAGL